LVQSLLLRGAKADHGVRDISPDLKGKPYCRQRHSLPGHTFRVWYPCQPGL